MPPWARTGVTHGMQASGFLAQAALSRAAQQPWAPLPAFSDTRPTYSRDAQDDGEGGPHEGARRMQGFLFERLGFTLSESVCMLAPRYQPPLRQAR